MRGIVALDIGGANIKASDGEERSESRPFPLWRDPGGLAEELALLVAQFGEVRELAVTMTGELADCFATKSAGVDHILAAVEQAAAGLAIRVWQTGGEFVTPDEARDLVPLVAAANWHALATWGARLVPAGTGLLIDVGSTTTDLIPLVQGLPAPHGRTDPERLRSGELLYRGVRRTPLCAAARSISFRGSDWPLAAELFATTGDIWLLAGDLAENPGDLNTANGRPATRVHARDRVLRQFCSDGDELDWDDAMGLVRALAAGLVSELASGIARIVSSLPDPVECFVTSGEGEFLIRRAIEEHAQLRSVTRVSVTGMLGPRHSCAACAYALARLSMEHSCTA